MSKNKAKCILGIILGCGLIGIVISQFRLFSITLPSEHQAAFIDEKISRFPLRLNVIKNQILDTDGQVVILKGVTPPDPSVLNERGKFNREFFADIKATHANVIRIPVHPYLWIKDEDYLWRYLDPIVSWAGMLNMYVIIDWHSTGRIATSSVPQMPDNGISQNDLTLEFWRLISRYFRESPNVIFEILYEPQSFEGDEKQINASEIVQVIRNQGAEQIIIVGGLDYGKDLAWVKNHAISGENIAYTSHIYPENSSLSWQNWLGDFAEEYPVLITEWGFMDENRVKAPSYLAGDEIIYGKPFLEYLDTHSIGWIACWYDDKWIPPMFADGGDDYTNYGDFVIRELSK